MILTRHIYTRTVFTSENHFTAVTNMYISHNYPSLRGFYYHIPNERPGMTARIQLKSMGVLAGVPDFCFMLPYVWYMELKMKGGKLSEAQTKLHKAWGERKIVIHTAFDALDVCDVMEGMCGLPVYP